MLLCRVYPVFILRFLPFVCESLISVVQCQWLLNLTNNPNLFTDIIPHSGQLLSLIGKILYLKTVKVHCGYEFTAFVHIETLLTLKTSK